MFSFPLCVLSIFSWVAGFLAGVMLESAWSMIGGTLAAWYFWECSERIDRLDLLESPPGPHPNPEWVTTTQEKEDVGE